MSLYILSQKNKNDPKFLPESGCGLKNWDLHLLLETGSQGETTEPDGNRGNIWQVFT